MKLQILAKLKDSQNNWKYILTAIILTFVVSGGTLWYQSKILKEIVSLTQLPEIKKVEKEKPEIIEEKFPFLCEVVSHPEFQKYFQELLNANPALHTENFNWNFPNRDVSYTLSLTPLTELHHPQIKIAPFPSPSLDSSFWKFSPNRTKAIAMHFKIFKTEEGEEVRTPVLLLYDSSNDEVKLLEDWRPPFELGEIEDFAVFWLDDNRLIHIFQGIYWYEVLGGEESEKPLGAFLEIDLIELDKGVVSWVARTERKGPIFSNPWHK